MPRPSHTAIPLASLLVMLKAEGFDISTSTLLDIQKVIASIGYDQLHDFRELKSVLSPFICRNKEEQERFNKVFDKYATSVTPTAALENISSTRISNKKSRLLAGGIAILLWLAAVAYYFWYLQRETSSVDLVVETPSGTIDQGAVIHDTVIFRTRFDKGQLSGNQFASIRIDDTVYPRKTEVRKLFRSAGQHQAEAWIQNSSRDTIARSAVKKIEVQCEKLPSVIIKKRNIAQNTSSAKKSYFPEFTNPSNDSSRYRFKWFINDNLASTEKELTTTHSSDNGYRIALHIDVDSTHCSTDSLTAILNELPAYDLSVTHTNPLKFDQKNWSRIAWVLGYGFLLPMAAGAFILRFKRKKNRKPVTAEVVEESPEEYTGPYQIEFKTQNDKITMENEIGRVAEAMRKRHVGEIMQLNIPGTISKTIRSGGFPSLTFTPRTQPTDFLVFVDKGNSTGHQAELFEYVLRRLQNEQVNITAYHFYKEPLLLSNEKLNHSMIPVDKVARLYLDTVLIIFSNTEGFFQSMNRKLKPWVSEKFKAWHRKIIITPVAFDDWDYKETALLSEGFTVVPADLNAHQLIIDEINNLNKDNLRKLPLSHSYSSRFVNFEDWQELKAYLGDDPSLLRWVCALAVYPYIDWKVTVAIGKAIESNLSGQARLVTYTNLLKISRIKWIQSGVQPDNLRLDMLHHLDNNTELLARNTILQLLTEVEEEITPSSLARNEFELNKTVNRFLLHTNNPVDNWLTERERKLMKTYVEKQWLDYPLESYLNSADKTLLKENGGQKSISPQEFFDADDELRKKRINRELMIRRSVAAALVVAGILILANFFSNKKNYTSPIQLADISINFSFGDNTIDPSLTEVSITTGGKPFAGQKISDSLFLIRGLPIDSTQPANVTVQNSRANFFIERPIDLKWRNYNLSVVAPPPKLPLYVRYNDVSAFANIEPQLTNDLYRFNISAAQEDFSDSSKIVYYEINQKARADSIVDIIKNTLGLNVASEFIEEIRTPAAAPILFLNLTTAGPCDAVSLNAMPVSLNEIWRGKTSNRLTTIDLPKRVIYYSTGAKASYGTYHIDDICMSSTGSYKLLTSASNQFKVFFLRSIEPQRFQLSACEDFLSTKEQAINVSENSCNNYDDMSLFYDRRPGIVYIPVDARNYTGQSATALRTIQQRLNANGTENFSLAVNNFFRSSGGEISSRQSQIQQRIPLSNKSARNIKWQSGTFRGTPFDRDFIEAKPERISAGQDAANNAGTDESRSGGDNPEANSFTKIADINYNEKYYPDKAGESILNRISQVLRADSKTKIKLRGVYTSDREKRIIDAYMQNTINLIVQRGLSSIKQIETEAYNGAPQKLKKAPSTRLHLHVEVLGLNFPDSFNKSRKY